MTPYFTEKVQEHIMRLSRGPLPTIIPNIADFCVALYKCGKNLPFGPSLN